MPSLVSTRSRANVKQGARCLPMGRRWCSVQLEPLGVLGSICPGPLQRLRLPLTGLSSKRVIQLHGRGCLGCRRVVVFNVWQVDDFPSHRIDTTEAPHGSDTCKDGRPGRW